MLNTSEYCGRRAFSLTWKLREMQCCSLQVREMSGAMSSPSLVILDVDAEKRYRLDSKATVTGSHSNIRCKKPKMSTEQ